MDGWEAAPEHPRLDKGEAHVWRLRLSSAFVDLSLLAADERARTERLHFERDRLRFAATRCELRRLSGRYLGAAPQALFFATGPHGKPRLAGQDGERLRFNVSHSGDLALLAFALDQEVGADVESHERKTEVDRLLPTVCTPAEQAVLRSLEPGERRSAFFDLWAGKEAVLKAMGSGLTVSPSRLELWPLPWQAACRVRVEGAGGGTFEACPLEVGLHSSAAFACAGAPLRLRLYEASSGSSG
jgi:4'-phosphopantetheinyl transferase